MTLHNLQFAKAESYDQSTDILRTNRLILRKGTLADVAAMHDIFSDQRAMAYWDHPAYDDPEPTQKFMAQFSRHDPDRTEEYIIERNGQCIGKAGMWGKPEIGYLLHPDHWGQGLVTEAMQAILPRIWSRFPDLDQITASADPRNLGSRRVLDKLGFGLVEIKEKDFHYGGVEWCDTAYYALPRTNTPDNT